MIQQQLMNKSKTEKKGLQHVTTHQSEGPAHEQPVIYPGGQIQAMDTHTPI